MVGKTRHAFLQVIIFCYCMSICCGTKFRYKTILKAENSLSVEWNVEYATQSVYFRITGELPDATWLLFGFSDYGGYKNADLFFYWKDPFGINWFKDTHTDSNGNLLVDRQQDYHVIREYKRHSRFVLDLKRKFNTCDVNDYKLDNGTTHVLYFTGETFPIGRNIIMYTKGLQRVQILKPDVPEHTFPDDVQVIDVTNPHITVPSTDTTYWWHVTRLPDLATKHHIIKYEGIIQKGNEQLVHHMEVFHCEAGTDQNIPHYNGPGLAEGKPPGLSVCRKVIGAWAMGASAVTLPAETGTPIGGKKWSRYVLLEVHYNNPGLLKGIKDSSGIRLYVTNKLRKYDSGIMELGLEYTNKMAIPPSQKMFKLTGYCTPHCTRIGLPKSGIKIYASQLHTHMTGKRVFTKHVRGGKELPELNRDNHYSPHFQEIRILPQPVHILPGDSLITTCEDSTENRDNVTLGGFSIKEEMCVNYVHYYPAVDLEVCKSSVDTSSLQRFFKFMNKYLHENTLPYKDIAENYQSINWTKTTTYMLKSFYDIAPLSVQCNRSDGSRFPGEWNGSKIPRITMPINKPEDDCS